MIKIDLLDISIQARPWDDHTDVREFGRMLSFKEGLNLVVGDNTSGKTTIVRSLFYCLGMEELIDGKAGDRSLDKSVKEKFRFAAPEQEEKDWYINSSYVVVQLSNHKGEVLTIKRSIKSEGHRENVLSVWKVPYSPTMKMADSKEYYIHSREDHNPDYGTGFYALLSDFGDIPIVNVKGRNTDSGTKLYLQTIFGLTYIEQTRGWSDFFANIRSFNIVSPKQRIIEYAMNYAMDEDMATANALKEKKRRYEEEWRSQVEAFNNYLSYNKMFVDKLNAKIDKQDVAIDELRIGVRDKGCDLAKYRVELSTQIDTLNRKAEQPGTVNCDQGYQKALQQYQEHKRSYEIFCLELADEKRKLENIRHQVAILDDETKRYRSLEKVNNIVSNLDVRRCPTCHQSLPVHDNQSFVVSKEQLDRSIKVYDMQKQFLKPMVDKLEASIKNQEMNKLYLENQLSVELASVEAIASDKMININPLTVEEQYVLVDSRSKLALLGSIESHIDQVRGALASLKEHYDEVCGQLAKQKNNETEKTPLDKQLECFRTMLHKFGYSSNLVKNIEFSEEKNTYQYLPIIEQGENREEIRSDSSASDFIRSIWAYYLTLLKEGVNHPGFLVMDEPCQHSMKEDSLKKLFEVCANIRNKQVILFCSSQPHTEEYENSQREGKTPVATNVIQTIVNSMNKVSLNYLIVDPKSITEKNVEDNRG